MARLLLRDLGVHVKRRRMEVAMNTTIDAEQVEHMLSHLARLRHQCNPEHSNVLESLRPAWLGVDTWDIVLEDFEAQRYSERAMCDYGDS